jgi:hypothetical protein
VASIAILGTGISLFASDTFPNFSKTTFDFAVPTNTPWSVMDTNALVGTNYVYKLSGQIFADPESGHIQTVAEGFSGKSDESTPWKTLTELLAAYQKGSDKNLITSLYTANSSKFLNQVYGNDQYKLRFQNIGRSIVGMQAVMGYDFTNIFLAQVKLDFKAGNHEVSQFCFALDGSKYKLIALDIQTPPAALMNIGMFLNKKVPR